VGDSGLAGRAARFRGSQGGAGARRHDDEEDAGCDRPHNLTDHQRSFRVQTSHPDVRLLSGCRTRTRPSSAEISTTPYFTRAAIRVPSGDQAMFPAQSKCRFERYRILWRQPGHEPADERWNDTTSAPNDRTLRCPGW
jgi:hypothetical protein